MTPLHWASVGAHKEIAELLLAAGCRKNKIDRSRNTPLETAKIQLKRLQDGIDHFGNEYACSAPVAPSLYRARPLHPRVLCLEPCCTDPFAAACSDRYKGDDRVKQISKFSSYVEFMEALPGIKKKE